MVSAASYTNVTLKVHHVLNLGDGLEVVAILAADLRHPDDVVRVDMQQGRSYPAKSADRQNFGKMLLVFGCIGSDFCKKICVLQHFSKSTRFSS